VSAVAEQRAYGDDVFDCDLCDDHAGVIRRGSEVLPDSFAGHRDRLAYGPSLSTNPLRTRLSWHRAGWSVWPLRS